MVVGCEACPRCGAVTLHVSEYKGQTPDRYELVQPRNDVTLCFFSWNAAMLERRNGVFTVRLNQNRVPGKDKVLIHRNDKGVADSLHFHFRWIGSQILNGSATAQLAPVAGYPVTESPCPGVRAEGTVNH